MPYDLEGALLEVCTCKILCPCWVGEDPDNGDCQSIMAWHINQGTVDSVDVSGLTLSALVNIPGNVLAGNWRVKVFVDDKSTPDQQEALLKVWTGQAGGPVADLIKLIGEVVGVERVPIDFQIEGVEGSVKIGTVAEADLVPYKGPTGQPSALHDSIFSTVPGSPAFVGKATNYRANVPELNIDINLQDHNAISGPFRFVG